MGERPLRSRLIDQVGIRTGAGVVGAPLGPALISLAAKTFILWEKESA